jgi:hypothetical protein
LHATVLERRALRKLRVYSTTGGFVLEIPDEARVTFGYFNPASAGKPYFGHGPGAETMKTTALRVYNKTGKTEDQIACFLGVTGFRDLATKRTEQTLNDPF